MLKQIAGSLIVASNISYAANSSETEIQKPILSTICGESYECVKQKLLEILSNGTNTIGKCTINQDFLHLSSNPNKYLLEQNCDQGDRLISIELEEKIPQQISTTVETLIFQANHSKNNLVLTEDKNNFTYTNDIGRYTTLVNE